MTPNQQNIAASSGSSPSLCSADFPLMVKGDFVYDAGGMRLLVCSPARDCSQIFREREVDADPHFICPECGRLGQRMAELRPDQERYFTPDGIFILPNAESSHGGEEHES